jgi:glucokinase
MGAGRGCRVIVAVALGTGVGGGIMIDGRLHLGAFGTAGEIAHQVIDPDGPLCGCGNRGCVETLTKADALTSLAGLDTAEEVFAAAADGDERALAAIDQVAQYLGLALANAVTLLGPDRVIVGGGISEAGELVLDPITRVVKERVTLVPADRIEVVLAELGPLAGAVGAALAGLDQAETRSR